MYRFIMKWAIESKLAFALRSIHVYSEESSFWNMASSIFCIPQGLFPSFELHVI